MLSVMAALHHRGATVVERDNRSLWLGKAGRGAAILMGASAPGVMTTPWRANPKATSNRARAADLIVPLSA